MPSNPVERWIALRSWLKEPLGQTLLAIEGQKINKLIDRLFGYHLLLLGEPQFLEVFSESPILHRVWVHLLVTDAFAGSAVQSRPDKLPIIEDEVDLVCLAHCLESIQNPHEVLRETYRVLKPEGHVVILGFNPWSLWGIWRLLVRYIKRVPWDGQFISRSRMKDWLALLGFDLLNVQMCFFRPPVANPSFLRATKWLEWIGRWCWPFWGGCYVMLAQKRVLTLTPIKPAWAMKRKLVPAGFVEPATRMKQE